MKASLRRVPDDEDHFSGRQRGADMRDTVPTDYRCLVDWGRCVERW